MGVKSTVDLSVEHARALFRALVSEDPRGEDDLLEHIEHDNWWKDPIINREFLRVLRGEEEIADLEMVSGSIEHVLEAAFDMYNHGEGYRNFSLSFGENRRRPRPLDPGNLVDLGIMFLIADGTNPVSQPTM